MRRIQYDRYGSPAVLRLADVEAPSPRRGEVLVKVEAAAANAMDWKIRRGEMRLVTGRRFPRGVGQDLAGTVLATGEGVTRVTVGEHVFGAAGFAAGAFGEAVVTREKYLTHKPDGVSFEQAATLPVAGLTALQALDKAGIGAGDRVFVGGIQGGVGHFATQLAALRGATVTGSARNTDTARTEGLPVDRIVPFDFHPDDLEPGFDLIFDTAGKIPTATSRHLVAHGGRIIDIVPGLVKMLRIIRYREFKGHMGAINSDDLDVLGRLVASGDLHVAIARTVPLEHAIDALTELEQYGTPKGGKLVIVP